MSNPGLANDNMAHKTGVSGKYVNDVDKSCRNEYLYETWCKMLYRVERKDDHHLARTLCQEWYFLSNFIKWAEEQDYREKFLDKDLLIIENRHYSPDTCCFLSREINNVIKTGKRKHDFMVGVRQTEAQKKNGKYCSQIGYKSRYIHLGTFDNELDAHKAYRLKKAEILREYAESEDEVVGKGLIVRAELYEDLSCCI